MSYETTSERVRYMMDKLGCSTQVEFGAISGFGRSMVNQILSGKIQSINEKAAYQLERTTGFRAEWILLGKGDPHIKRLVGDARLAKLHALAEDLPGEELEILNHLADYLHRKNLDKSKLTQAAK